MSWGEDAQWLFLALWSRNHSWWCSRDNRDWTQVSICKAVALLAVLPPIPLRSMSNQETEGCAYTWERRKLFFFFFGIMTRVLGTVGEWILPLVSRDPFADHPPKTDDIHFAMVILRFWAVLSGSWLDPRQIPTWGIIQGIRCNVNRADTCYKTTQKWGWREGPGFSLCGPSARTLTVIGWRIWCFPTSSGGRSTTAFVFLIIPVWEELGSHARAAKTLVVTKSLVEKAELENVKKSSFAAWGDNHHENHQCYITSSFTLVIKKFEF